MGLFGKGKDIDDDNITIPKIKYDEMLNRIKELEDTVKKLKLDELGFKDKRTFLEDISTFSTEKADYVLVLLNINVERANNISRTLGDDMLSVIANLYKDKFEYFYHLGGEKFNILIKEYDFKQEVFDEIDKTIEKICDDKRNELSLDEDFKVTVYYGKAFSKEEYSNEYQKLVPKAIEEMYKDKKQKRPKNKNIARIEQENKRLFDSVSNQHNLMKKLKEDIKNSKRLQKEKEYIEFYKKAEEILQMRRELEFEKKGYYLIPFTDEENGMFMEKPLSKNISTMWYFKSDMKYISNGGYHYATVMVFPLEYVKAPMTITSLAIIFDESGVSYKQGKMIEISGSGLNLTINSRFTKDGDFNVNVAIMNEVDMQSKTDNVHKGNCTPIHFGKYIETENGKFEIFPYKENINNTLDSIIYNKDTNTLSLSKGTFENYNIIKNGNEYELIDSNEM